MNKIMIQLALLPSEYRTLKNYCKENKKSLYIFVTDLVREKVRSIESSDSFKPEYTED